ncbi:MAG: N-acetyltransferase family protein [Bacillus sp. (in: Bacteria)]|nr:N-acetyltransferase family protein [Bacillus sp. (in: firmicutes)]
MKRDIVIDKMHREDWGQVREIYRGGVATGQATFEKETPSWEKWDQSYTSECRLVARAKGEIVGWAALSPVSSRCVYGGVAETSVYVRQSCVGDEIGGILLASLIIVSEAHGYWTLQAGIFPENEASLNLHLKHGFREVGRRERIGKMDGVWRDTILLERRSEIAGAS